jgi:hypothetical protein
MGYNIKDYATQEPQENDPVYGWTVDTVRKNSVDDLNKMRLYFEKQGIYVAIGITTIKELVNENTELKNTIHLLRQQVKALEKKLPSAVTPRGSFFSLFRH